jgi:cysteine synthase B
MREIIQKQTDQSLLQRARALKAEVGNTPLIPIRNLLNNRNVMLYAKQEWQQLSGSVKCRPAYAIIIDALENGLLDNDKILLDATSGNTGIAYAAIAARLGIRVTLCLPENASIERKQLLSKLGAHIIYTSKFEGTDGAQEVAMELAAKNPDQYFYADQYKNDNNWKSHYHTTAPEIIHEMPGITHFVAGLGTTGTFTGTGRRLKEYRSDIQVIALHPDSALHALEGWKHLETAKVPAIYDASLADSNQSVTTEDAFEMIRQAHEKEGLLLSPSAAANLSGALRIAEQLKDGVVVTMLPDNADKYSEIINKIMLK